MGKAVRVNRLRLKARPSLPTGPPRRILDGMASLPEPIAYITFEDGLRQPVYEEFLSGKWVQYVLDDDGEPIFGIWYKPRVECDVPLIVEGK